MFDSFEEMRRMQREMNRMFENLFRPISVPNLRSGLFREPLSDIEEKEDKVVVRVDLPGIDKKYIQLVVRDNNVEVKAQKKKETKIEKKGFLKQERSFTCFYRVLPLPVLVNAEEAKAEYKDGVLKIEIPKKEKIKVKEKKIIVR